MAGPVPRARTGEPELHADRRCPPALDEAQQADEKKDTKKAEEIGKKMDAMGKQLGPEYAALMDSMQNLNEKEADAIGKAMEPLDKLCGK